MKASIKSQINIFVSHIHEEVGIAQVIEKELKDCFHDKVQVFLSEVIPFGHDWQRSVKTNLENADLLLVLFSPESIERAWINIEAGYGIISEKKVVPMYCLGVDQDKLHYIYQRLKGINIENASDVKILLEENIGRQLLNETEPTTKNAIEHWQTSISKAISEYLNKQVLKVKMPLQSYFHIYSERFDKCLDVLNWSKISGSSIVGYPIHGGNNQLWQLQRVERDCFIITSAFSHKCLEVDTNGEMEGANIIQNEYKGSEFQHWDLAKISNDEYKISLLKDSKMCITIEEPGSDPKVSTIKLKTWGHNLDQKWKFKVTATVTPV